MTRSARPGFVEPMLATLAELPLEGDDWTYERKFDGIRILAVRDGDTVRLWTRNHLDRSRSYPALVEALLDQPVDRFVLDGEVVGADGDIGSFAALQQRSGAVVYEVFDALHLAGVDITDQSLRDRRELLAAALDVTDPVRRSEPLPGDPAELLEKACVAGWEGLVAKRSSSTYRSGRSRDWLKLKCVADQELVIGGWTDPHGSRVGLGALLVGYYDGNRLRYAGKVGTGFDAATLADLARRLGVLERATSPFDGADPIRKGAHWAEPRLVCQVGFAEWTGAGRLRHPRFLGLREDKDPRSVVRERPG
ncbi:MAG TPA: non-homologous end-joining DNA ligase [Acidimicrobiales bacterium]|jgi:DNA ligase D-like protein (predicted ligase)|nr:non-homologous end-joining DNA ligase [Acidimicrobiales bacterium]